MSADYQGEGKCRTQSGGEGGRRAPHSGQGGNVFDGERPAALERRADQSAHTGLERGVAREFDEFAASQRWLVPDLRADDLMGLLVFVPAGTVFPKQRGAQAFDDLRQRRVLGRRVGEDPSHILQHGQMRFGTLEMGLHTV